MKVCIVTIGRLENLYINEFIEHYKSLGVDKIFLGDNNYGNGERFINVINKNFVDNDFIEIIDLIDNKTDHIQQRFFEDMYNQHKEEYDWFCFFDIDEYMYIDNFNNIKDFLSQSIYNDFDMIHINWICYDDNDLLYYDDRPLIERFIRKSKFLFDNLHVKTIARNNIENINFLLSHTIHSPKINCCNIEGLKEDNTIAIGNNFSTNGAHLKHYRTKTLEETIQLKILGRKRQPDTDRINFGELMLDNFFNHNNFTLEKNDYLNKYLDEIKKI